MAAFCRLLRNRISAQQARERKKQHVSSLEDQVAGQAARIEELAGRVRDLELQNATLRRLILTMRPESPAAPPLLTPLPPSPARDELLGVPDAGDSGLQLGNLLHLEPYAPS